MPSNLLVALLGNGAVLEVRGPDNGILTKVLLHLQNQLLQLIVLVTLGLLLFSSLNSLLWITEEVELFSIRSFLSLVTVNQVVSGDSDPTDGELVVEGLVVSGEKAGNQFGR